MDKLFVVTRKDMSTEAIAVQSGHAAIQFVFEHPETSLSWFVKSNTLIYLAVPDETALERLIERALAAGVPYSIFREPDYQDSITGVAFGPTGWRLVASLPLALRERKAA